MALLGFTRMLNPNHKTNKPKEANKPILNIILSTEIKTHSPLDHVQTLSPSSHPLRANFVISTLANPTSTNRRKTPLTPNAQ